MCWGWVGLKTDKLSEEAMAPLISITKKVTGEGIYLRKHTFQVKKRDEYNFISMTLPNFTKE